MIKTNPLSVKDIEKLAMAFREHYQIKKDEYFPVLEIIDKLYEDGIYRSTFTLCHEFFHYVQSQLLKFEFEEVENCKSYEDIDWQANEFAGQILIPTEYIDYDEEYIQKNFHVSLECVLTRKAKSKKRAKKIA